MGASLRETRTQADVNIYPVIQEMREAVTGVFSSLKRLLEDYFHVPESRMRSSRQRGDQKRLRDIATGRPVRQCLPFWAKGGIVKSPSARPNSPLGGDRWLGLRTGLHIPSSGMHFLTFILQSCI